MTEQSKKFIERRKHQRYYPDRKNQPQVHFMLNGGDKFSVDVVNISQGGLLGYTFKHNFVSVNNHRKIKDVEIIFPGRLSFHCSGKLIRVQPTREQRKCFCAIQFDKNGYDENHDPLNIGEKIQQSLHPAKEIVIPDQIFLNRVTNSENYFNIQDPWLASEARNKVYDSFDDITSKLELEEKRSFFEMVDELKKREPDWSEDLKQAFVNLCRVGMEQAMKKKFELDGRYKVVNL